MRRQTQLSPCPLSRKARYRSKGPTQDGEISSTRVLGTPGRFSRRLQPETTDRRTGKRKIKKYRRPPGSGNVLDVHPFVRERLRTTREPIFITEGVMKGDSLVSLGACAISLFGVSGWRGKVHDPKNPEYDDNGEVIRRTGPLDDWAKIPMTGREVFIVFDSDVVVKESVHSALRNLWNFLLGEARSSTRSTYRPSLTAIRRSAWTTTSPATRVSPWRI
jgi:hypothetical protein